MLLTRRVFLGGVGAAVTAAVAPVRAASPENVTTLTVQTAAIEVRGRTVEMLDVLQPNGTRGLNAIRGQRFRVRLVNAIDRPTLVHWHGLTPPAHQDGVPILSQPALEPGGFYDYDFPLTEPGTYWMHSHQGLQEQQLLSGPLIIADPSDSRFGEQDFVLELGDFTFADPRTVYDALRRPASPAPKPVAGTPAKRDANDVNYDAYLVNRRPIENPEIVRIEARSRLRLRVINAGAATNFTVDLGELTGTLIAVDGSPVEPVRLQRFGIGIAQRCDLRIETPGPGIYPIFAVREGDRVRGAAVLATKNARVPSYSAVGTFVAPYNDLALEARLRPVTPLPSRRIDRALAIDLTGDMAKYAWTIDDTAWTDDLALSGKFPFLPVKRGERVEIVMRNKTMMTHPMHLHGHRFQVVAIDGHRFPGAVRDSVLVPPKQSVTIAFDAVNPGWWFYHCHNLYHLAAGMATSVKYV